MVDDNFGPDILCRGTTQLSITTKTHPRLPSEVKHQKTKRQKKKTKHFEETKHQIQPSF